MNTKPLAMRDALLKRIHLEMEKNASIFFVSADFGSPVLDDIIRDFPERFLNVGIAEQNLINVSTGLALEGFDVYAYAIAPFITMRCLEQIKVNLALLCELRLVNVNLIGVGAGFSYVVSGPTHHAIEDISLMRTFPNFEIISPADAVSAAAAFDFSLNSKFPKYFRLDSQPLTDIYDNSYSFPDCGFSLLRDGHDALFIATGYMTRHALQIADLLAKNNIDCKVIDIVKLKNPDISLLASEISNYKQAFTFEEGFIRKGGLDSMILHIINDYEIPAKLNPVGLSDDYRFALGSRSDIMAEYGLDVHNVATAVKRRIRK